MIQSILKFFQSFKFKYYSIFLIAFSGAILFLLMVSSIKNETYELKSFQIAPETIRSIKTFEDTVKTNSEREKAAAEVKPVYQFKEDVAKNRIAIIPSLFDYILEVKNMMVNDIRELTNRKTTKDYVADLREKLEGLELEEPSMRLSNEALTTFLSMNISDLVHVQNTLGTIVEEELGKPIRFIDLPVKRYEIESRIRLEDSIPTSIEPYLITIGRALIVETEVINEELTAARIEQAKSEVEPTRILQGQVIVREGQMIDAEIYNQLKLAGLLTNESSVKPISGLILFVLFITVIIYMHFSTWQDDTVKKKKSLLIFLSIFIILVIIMKLIALIEKDFDLLIAFLFPTALGTMLVKLLTNERLALMITIITAATAGVMLQEGYAAIIQMEVALYILFGGLVSLYLLGNTGRRSTILRTSLGVSISNLLFIAFYLLMTQSSYDLTELIFYSTAAITSGIISGALTIGLMPFFESGFRILSDMRLIELSNPNHPLLKKVLIETPGTYHHSVMVANLSDAACESIGANGLLARVGSYYHDIGKTIRPGFFIENQHVGQNPHDALPPEKSRDIIISHAEDGARLLEKHKMPIEIVDIARQHHGTSLLKYFYVKARDLGKDVNEEEYRYKGPKPQSKEIAIISIADSIEAAVRSMKEPNTTKIAALVRSIINEKLQDGQFDECDLSMKELKRIEASICVTLNGIFHNRIEYPE